MRSGGRRSLGNPVRRPAETPGIALPVQASSPTYGAPSNRARPLGRRCARTDAHRSHPPTKPQQFARERIQPRGSRGEVVSQASDATAARPTNDGRDETRLEQLDRNTIELLNELRVAGTGIQVLLAFLLVAPFDSRFSRLSAFERYDYFVTLVCIAVAAALLIAPSIHHRILFRHHQKPYLLRVGNQAMIVAMVFLAVGLTGILVLISDMMFGGTAATVAGVIAAVAIAAVWFAVPLRRRWATERNDPLRPRRSG